MRCSTGENFCVLKSDVLQGIGYLLTHDEWIFFGACVAAAAVGAVAKGAAAAAVAARQQQQQRAMKT